MLLFNINRGIYIFRHRQLYATRSQTVFKKTLCHFVACFNVSILNLKLCKLSVLRTKIQEKNRVHYSFQIEFKFVWKLLTVPLRR